MKAHLAAPAVLGQPSNTYPRFTAVLSETKRWMDEYTRTQSGVEQAQTRSGVTTQPHGAPNQKRATRSRQVNCARTALGSDTQCKPCLPVGEQCRAEQRRHAACGRARLLAGHLRRQRLHGKRFTLQAVIACVPVQRMPIQVIQFVKSLAPSLDGRQEETLACRH
jgi:hypothetical protein